MIFVIAFIATFISILCCKSIKKPAVRVILGMVAFFNILIMILAGSFIYTTKYKIHDVASYTSPDGKYELLFQQVGDPDWPFGHTHARLVLKDETGTIVKYSFDIAADGANASSDLCQVTWKATQVEAVISGEEQNDNQYILYFNGKTESNQLDTRFGIYPTAPVTLKKVAMFLSSGDDNMYDGAKFSYDGDFLGYLGLEGMGIFTNHDKNVMSRIKDMASSL